MSIIALPLNLAYNEFAWGVNTYELEESSDQTGNTATRIIAPPRWTAHFTSIHQMTLVQAARWEALMLSLRGGNVLALYDVVRYNPAGSLRGSPTLASSLAVGATTATFSSAAGGVKQGDWLQFGSGFGSSQLVKIMADADPSGGSLSVVFENPIRKVISSGSVVVWDKPVAYFRRTSRSATLGMYDTSGTGQGGFSVDLMERFS